MTEENRKQEGIAIPKVSYEGGDKVLKEQVIHYEKGTRRIIIFTVVGLLMGWFGYRYYGETFLPMKMILAVPYKLSEMLHHALHPAVLGELGKADAFFPQAPILSWLAEYGTSALFGGAIYGSLAYFTGDKRIFNLSGYVKFGCAWAALISVWTAGLLGGNAWQVTRNNELKDVTGFFISGEHSGSGYYQGASGETEQIRAAMVDAFYGEEGPEELPASAREPSGEQKLELVFGSHQGVMDALIHREKGYLVTDQGYVYQMQDEFMKIYNECVEKEERGYEEMDD